MTDSKPMGLGDGAGTDVAAKPEKVPQGSQDRPYCRKHNVLMKAATTGATVTRYKCPVPGCKEREKRARSRASVPSEPMVCPHCRQRAVASNDKKAKPVFCEVDFSHSRSGTIRMVCPVESCTFYVIIPRPDIAALSRRMRDREGDLAVR